MMPNLLDAIRFPLEDGWPSWPGGLLLPVWRRP
jgi:hypothetical protein